MGDVWAVTGRFVAVQGNGLCLVVLGSLLTKPCRVPGLPHLVSPIVALDYVQCDSELLQLIGADIRAMCEAKIEHTKAPKQIFMSKSLSVLVNQLKWAANRCPAHHLLAALHHALYFLLRTILGQGNNAQKGSHTQKHAVECDGAAAACAGACTATATGRS